MIQTTLRVPEALYIRIKEEAQRKGMTLNAYVLNILWEFHESVNAEKKVG